MRFAALRARWYRGYLTGGTLTMAGDHAEHALTYWVMWQYFHSPLLAGFAVVSHWVPHLFFSIPFGALADRFDCRRIIQLSLGLFIVASLGWGILILSGTLQPWHCVVLLLVHGFASALWNPADGVLIYDIAGKDELPSAVRLMATGMSLGQLIGPGFGAVLLFTVGSGIGMFINVALYLPFVIYLFVMPLDGHHHRAEAPPRLKFRDVFSVLPQLPRYPAILAVMIMQAALGIFIGVALLPLLPEFGELLGLQDSGLGYGLLLIATSVGAVSGGLAMESIGRIRASAKLAILSTALFAVCTLVFALSRSFPLSIAALVVAGASTIVAASTSQTIVQLQSPSAERGRFMGAFSMTGMGSRAGSGILIGGLGLLVGVPSAVAIAAGALLASAAILMLIVAARGRDRAVTASLSEQS
ncbi:MAG TPA: MFS transporter [Pseudolysinimonas sp.]|nr:MFS transporter [Pseudolysinimonas sp.]